MMVVNAHARNCVTAASSRGQRSRIADAVDAVDARRAVRPARHAVARARAVLVMRYYLDLASLIAATLGCRPATVRSITSRTLARLRKELSDAR